MKLFILAILLPAVFVAAGGAWLVSETWRRLWDDEREALELRARIISDSLMNRAHEENIDGMRPPDKPPRRFGNGHPPPADRPPRHPHHRRVRELLARVSAALRRSDVAPRPTDGDGTFRIGDTLIDANRFIVHAPGEPEQALTVRELGLLKTFAASRTLDQHILQIRRKLGTSGAHIETIRGAGYRLKA